MRKTSVWALALLAACGGGDSFEYGGTPGTPVAAHFGGDLLADVVVRVNGGPDTLFTADTGAPITILDGATFTDHADGAHRDDIEAFLLTFKQVQDVSFKIYGGTDGLIGGDLLKHFAFTLDYEGDRVWLSDPFDPKKLPDGVEVAAEQTVPFEVLGGGRGATGGNCTTGCTIDYPATRILIPATVEGQASPVWMLVDTGASIVVLDQGLYATLASDPNRPRLDGASLVGVSNPSQPSFLTRVWRLSLGKPGGPHIDTDDVEVAVIPGSTLLDSLSKEVGRPVQALVGATFLQHYLSTVDYQHGILRLARYTSPTRLNPNAFVGPGFQMEHAGIEWAVYEVYTNKDAYAQGIRVGDIIEQIGNMPIAGQSAATVQGILDSYSAGDHMQITTRRGTVMTSLNVLVEDLLPHYPPPT